MGANRKWAEAQSASRPGMRSPFIRGNAAIHGLQGINGEHRYPSVRNNDAAGLTFCRGGQREREASELVAWCSG